MPPETHEREEREFDALLEGSSLGSPRVKAVRASGDILPWVSLAFQLAATHPFTLAELSALTFADTTQLPEPNEQPEQ